MESGRLGEDRRRAIPSKTGKRGKPRRNEDSWLALIWNVTGARVPLVSPPTGRIHAPPPPPSLFASPTCSKSIVSLSIFPATLQSRMSTHQHPHDASLPFWRHKRPRRTNN